MLRGIHRDKILTKNARNEDMTGQRRQKTIS